jgi:DNA polymerase
MIEQVLGLQRKDVYITNVVKCHPMANPKNPELRGNDRAPAPDEIRSCKLWWQAEMEIIQPKAICILGASALSAFFEEKKALGEYRGQTFRDQRFSQSIIFVTYHPAAILRNPNLLDSFKEDFQKLKNLLKD